MKRTKRCVQSIGDAGYKCGHRCAFQTRTDGQRESRGEEREYEWLKFLIAKVRYRERVPTEKEERILGLVEIRPDRQ